jgi:putative Ca2+/H+ antiporter (TMEM165/GDT1 family)
VYPALALASGVMTIIIFLVNIAFGIPNDYILYAVALIYFICFALWMTAEPKPQSTKGDVEHK